MIVKDWRVKENRSEAFERFYYTHIITNDASPDIAVERWIADDQEWNYERRCSMALFHGATYAGPCETMISDVAPVIHSASLNDVKQFFIENKNRLLFSPDAKYRKIYFDKFLDSVAASLKPFGTLGSYIDHSMHEGSPEQSYADLRKRCFKDWFQWGRMGHWCFSESLHRFINAPINPPDMEFGSGGDTITAGWAFCQGRDDIVELINNHKSIAKSDLLELEDSAARFLSTFKEKHPNIRNPELVQRFTLETACCNFKRQFKGTRYGICYIDEQYDEITYMKTLWPEYRWLWDLYMKGRQAVIPEPFLYEMNPFFDESKKAYQSSWHQAMGQYGASPRVDSYFAKQDQQWLPIELTKWYNAHNESGNEFMTALGA